VTEKRKRTYSLKKVRTLIEQNKKINPGIPVISSINDMGFSVYEAHQEITKLENRHFYKSMTQYSNNKVWLDVYKKEIKGIPVYIKFKLLEDRFLLTSFKPDDS